MNYFHESGDQVKVFVVRLVQLGWFLKTDRPMATKENLATLHAPDNVFLVLAKGKHAPGVKLLGF